MIKAYLFKMENSGWPCDNTDCQHNPSYHDRVLSTFFIKQGVTCLAITLSGGREIYCKDCIDMIYHKLKPVLDKKLWPFE